MAETYQKQEGPRESDKSAKKEAEVQKPQEPKAVVRAGADKKLATEQRAEQKAEEKKAAPKKEKPAEKKREVVLERVYTFNLQAAYSKPHLKRANTATRLLRALLARHMKAPEEYVRVGPDVNEYLRERGLARPAKRVKVQASKDREGLVWAKLAG